jgi:hypothetical protein
VGKPAAKKGRVSARVALNACMMMVKEIVKRSGFSTKTLRFEKIG